MKHLLSITGFAGIMLGVFYLTFGSLGIWLSRLLSLAIERTTGLLSTALLQAGVNPAFHGLVIDGVCAGVGSVLSFLPVIAVLFFCLSLLEDTGYMDRAAVTLDRPMRLLGLSGRCIVPLLMGFGCSVPAVMAARRLSGEKERLTVTRLIPFMSCSAKLPLYAMFASAFFQQEKWLLIAALYGLGIVLAILLSLALKRREIATIKRRKLFPALGKAIPGRRASRSSCPDSRPHAFGSSGCTPLSGNTTLPSYRLPSMRRVFSAVWANSKGFVQKAFTVIFTASILIWFLQSFDISFNMVDNSENSILAAMGKAAAPIFEPLGFGDWRSATALLTGMTAKEAIVSTLAVLTSTAEGASLNSLLTELYTPLSVCSFLIFCLLYTPCVAALAAMGKGGGKGTALLVMAFQCAVAWFAAFLFYTIGGLFI